MIQKQALIKLAQIRLAINHVIRQLLIKQATNDDPSLLLYPLAGAGIGGGIGMLFGDSWKRRLWNGLTGAGIGGTAGLIAARNLRHRGNRGGNSSSSYSNASTQFEKQQEQKRQEDLLKYNQTVEKAKQERKQRYNENRERIIKHNEEVKRWMTDTNYVKEQMKAGKESPVIMKELDVPEPWKD